MVSNSAPARATPWLANTLTANLRSCPTLRTAASSKSGFNTANASPSGACAVPAS